jgi:excisionase family DNA binding protein
MSHPQTAQQPAAQLHGVPDVQKRLNMGRSKVYEFMATGELRSIKCGHRRLVSEAALVEFINRLEAAGSDDLPAGRGVVLGVHAAHRVVAAVDALGAKAAGSGGCLNPEVVGIRNSIAAEIEAANT